MMPSDEGLKSEYGAVVAYHTALVQSRFTVAGLYSAAFAVLATVQFKPELTAVAKLGLAVAGLWITLCLWVLELRSRALYAAVATRGIEIERHYWGVNGANWYKGFFSLQYKRPPSLGESTEGVPHSPPDPDPVSISLFFRVEPFRLPPKFSLWVTHSRGLDLLYLGGAAMWLVILIRRLLQVVA